jgi:hypothetical protein
VRLANALEGKHQFSWASLRKSHSIYGKRRAATAADPLGRERRRLENQNTSKVIAALIREAKDPKRIAEKAKPLNGHGGDRKTGASRVANSHSKAANKLSSTSAERLSVRIVRDKPEILRTSTVVESPFTTVRLRTTAAKRFKKVENATTLIWKIIRIAESTFRRLKGAELLPAVYAGVQHVDGVQRTAKVPQRLVA